MIADIKPVFSQVKHQPQPIKKDEKKKWEERISTSSYYVWVCRFHFLLGQHLGVPGRPNKLEPIK